MNLLSLQDISKQYDHKPLLQRISLHIHKGEKIAVVGRNGSGKSSLLKLIEGVLELDSGERVGVKGLRILSLSQKPQFAPSASVREVIQESMREIEEAHRRLESITAELASQGHSALSAPNSSLGNHSHNAKAPLHCGARPSAPHSQGFSVAQSNTANTRIVCGEILESQAISESTASDSCSVIASAAKQSTDSEPTPAVGYSPTAIESSFSSERCSEQALKASSGWGIVKGEGATSQFKPLPLNKKENTESKEVLESQKAKARDFEKLDSESKNQIESAMAGDSKNLESAIDSESKRATRADSKIVDCHADKSARNDDRLDSKNVDSHALPEARNDDKTKTASRSSLESQADYSHANKPTRNDNPPESQADSEKSLHDEYHRLSTFLDSCNGWDLQARVDALLERFELTPFEARLANSLSGGEQKRVALACLLLRPCDILLLDEPTNHLDVEMVAFLENFLLDCAPTLVFISHDRHFIDRLATRIVEIDEGGLRSFSGGYGDYLRQKEELLQNLSHAHEKLLKLLKSEEEWLRRGVKARLKRNEGRKNRILALRDEAKKNPSTIRKIRLELEREQKSFNRTGSGENQQKCLYEIEHLNKSLGGKILVRDLSLRILRNEKIAVVGKNGSGKSSFLKLLLGESAPDSGRIKVGDIRIGYFDQHSLLLDDSKDLLETFCPNGGEHISVRGKTLHVYGYLKNFLFPKEFLTQKIAALSGGERNRVALALLFTKEVDCFILDEPTNDLDIQTINIIEEYLLSLQCAVIFVSHDRYFVDKLASKLLIFEGEGRITQSYARYSEYLELESELRELRAYEALAAKDSKSVDSKNVKPKRDESLDSINTESARVESAPTKSTKSAESTQSTPAKKPHKLSYKDKLALEQLPDEISALEMRQKQLQDALSNPQAYQQQGISALASELATLEQELETKVERYLQLLELQA